MIAGETVTLLRSSIGGPDAYGNDVITWAPETIAGAVWVPGVTAEATQGAEQVTFDATCFLPPGTRVGPLDKLTRAGETFEVTGENQDWVSPFTAIRSPIRVHLRRVQGGTAHSVVPGG